MLRRARNLRFILLFSIGVLGIIGAPAVWAVGSLGDVLGNAMVVFVGFIGVLSKIALIVGIAFLIGSVIQYIQHRRNPIQVRISRPITLFILGLALIALPYIAMLSESSFVIEEYQQKIEEEQKAQREARRAKSKAQKSEEQTSSEANAHQDHQEQVQKQPYRRERSLAKPGAKEKKADRGFYD